MTLLISVDPGSRKCGLVLVDISRLVLLDARVVEANNVVSMISLWYSSNEIDEIIIGNGTSSKYWQLQLEKNIFNSITLVDEKSTTFRSRYRYWEIWPPNKILRILPKELIFPPKNLDAIAALLLLEDYLHEEIVWPPRIKIRTWP